MCGFLRGMRRASPRTSQCRIYFTEDACCHADFDLSSTRRLNKGTGFRMSRVVGEKGTDEYSGII